MAVVGGHFAVVAAGAGGADDGGERADVFGWEEPVGGDADQGEVGGDAAVGDVGVSWARTGSKMSMVRVMEM